MREDERSKAEQYLYGDERSVVEVVQRPVFRFNGEDLNAAPLGTAKYINLTGGINYGRFSQKLVAIIGFDDASGPVKTLLVEGRVPWKNRFKDIESVWLSPDGFRVVALVVLANGQRTLAVDDRLWQNSFEDVFKWGAVFSPDSKRIAIDAERGQGKILEIIVDDKPWDGVGCSLLDDPRTWLAWENIPIDNNHLFRPQFSEHGVCCAVLPRGIKHDAPIDYYEGWTLAVEGKTWPGSYLMVDGSSVKFGSYGRHAALSVTTNAGKTIVVDGVPWSQCFNFVSRHIFLPNGQVSAVALVRMNTVDYEQIVVDGQVLGPWMQKADARALDYEVLASKRKRRFSIRSFWSDQPKTTLLKRTFNY